MIKGFIVKNFEKMSEIEQIQEDFLGLIENHDSLTPEMRKNLLKGVLGNFFDYLKEKLPL